MRSRLPKISHPKSCDIKSTIVSKDERDQGFRAICNFGHTIGHAIELVSNYSINHGQAVALGILVESFILRTIKHSQHQRIRKDKKYYERFPLSHNQQTFPSIKLVKKCFNLR